MRNLPKIIQTKEVSKNIPKRAGIIANLPKIIQTKEVSKNIPKREGIIAKKEYNTSTQYTPENPCFYNINNTNIGLSSAFCNKSCRYYWNGRNDTRTFFDESRAQKSNNWI